MCKGDSPRPIPDPQKFRDNWDAIFGKKSDEKSSACPKCGDEGYSVYHTKPGQGDPSTTYCICNNCQHEFDGKTSED